MAELAWGLPELWDLYNQSISLRFIEMLKIAQRAPIMTFS